MREYITLRMSNNKKITGQVENLVFFKDVMPSIDNGKIAVNINHVIYARTAKDDEIEHAQIHGW